MSGVNHWPTMQSWKLLFDAIGPDIPGPVKMAWIAEESGGNPCAIGETPSPGAAHPQEYGIAQLNYEDPSNLAIARPEAVRAMCGSGPGMWAVMLRDMTDAEQLAEAGYALDLMRHCRDVIRPFVAGWGWSELGGDFWSMVKLWHASPALVKVAPAIAQQLGRAPANFAEYQNHADAIGLANNLGAGHKGGSRGYLDGVWLNVARVGRSLTAPSVGV